MSSVVVVGSINVDVVMHVPGFPVPGVTLLADRVERSPGGKGANQAVAAARAGAATRLLGAVGDDGDSAPQVDALVAAGVDVSGVETCSGRTTGTAFVMVAPSGENAIVVDAGANGLLDLRRVVAALSDRGTTAPDVVLLQSEVGAAVVDAAAAAAYERGIRVVVNNGPWLPLAAATLEAADPLVVNEHEAAEACDASGARRARTWLMPYAGDTAAGRWWSPAAPRGRRSAARRRRPGSRRCRSSASSTRRVPGTPSSGRSLPCWRRAAA